MVFQLTYPVWGTTSSFTFFSSSCIFQLTYPVWGTTAQQLADKYFISISTHVPRVGYNLLLRFLRHQIVHFNSRTPCGVQHTPLQLPLWHFHFNSRTPCGVQPRTQGIVNCDIYFNSRTPCGVQQNHLMTFFFQSIISTHVPRVGYN